MMADKRFFKKAVLAWGILVVAGMPVLAHEGEGEGPKPPAPVLSMHVYGETTPVQDAREPMLITLTLGNPRAAAIASDNRQKFLYLKAIKKSSAWKQLSKKERQAIEQTNELEKLPVFPVGSKKTDVWQMVSLSLTRADASEVPVRMRPLVPTVDWKGRFELNEENNVLMWFGIESDALKDLSEGLYTLRAVLDSTRAEGMWQGRVEANPVTFTLKREVERASLKEMDQWEYQHARFYLMDKQFEKVEPYIQRMLTLNPESINAWTLRADIAYEKSDYKNAEAAYQLITSLYRKQYKDERGIEPPEYLFSRILAAQEQQGIQRR